MQGYLKKALKKSAPTPKYVSPTQLLLDGFQTPFDQTLNPANRWVVLAHLIPWYEICNLYLKHVGISSTGRPALSPHVVIGSLIIKHMCNLDDREAVDQMSENIYMEYFLGYSSFTNEAPFDASLFVEFRKLLGMENVNAINEKIVALKTHVEELKKSTPSPTEQETADERDDEPPENKGRVIFDATACPQDIAYPTDLNLLSEAQEMSETLIDQLHDPILHEDKPRTYRKIARKRYLNRAQKKNKSRKAIHRAVGGQLGYLKSNLASTDRLLEAYPKIPLKPKFDKYLFVISTLYDQQREMFKSLEHRIDDRIVSIHQPHVRPIVRGKSQAKVEFGAKILVSVIDGISFLDELSWDAFNEGNHMMDYVEQYRRQFGFYPRELLADQIYCTRANRASLKEKEIKLLAKPLGRASAVKVQLSPGERNPILGKFGQAKTGYVLDRIKARLQGTSETWIACIILVLNLVKLTGVGIPCLVGRMAGSFSAWLPEMILNRFADSNCCQIILRLEMWQSQQVKPRWVD